MPEQAQGWYGTLKLDPVNTRRRILIHYNDKGVYRHHGQRRSNGHENAGGGPKASVLTACMMFW
jgi:hypothetical protein